jgi:HAMP domain-containing protein
MSDTCIVMKRIQVVMSGVVMWMRRAVRAVFADGNRADATRKLNAVRAAVAHSFPTGNIEQMLDEIGQGSRHWSIR